MSFRARTRKRWRITIAHCAAFFTLQISNDIREGARRTFRAVYQSAPAIAISRHIAPGVAGSGHAELGRAFAQYAGVDSLMASSFDSAEPPRSPQAQAVLHILGAPREQWVELLPQVNVTALSQIGYWIQAREEITFQHLVSWNQALQRWLEQDDPRVNLDALSILKLREPVSIILDNTLYLYMTTAATLDRALRSIGFVAQAETALLNWTVEDIEAPGSRWIRPGP